MSTIHINVPNWLDKIFTWPLMAYRKRKYGYSFRKIYLGQNHWTILDTQDYYKFSDIGWALGGYKKNFYAVGGIKNKNGEFEFVRLHRMIMNPLEKQLVDHRNCDGLDNRRENLRIATKAQNSCNSRKRKNATSQFLGVHFHKKMRLWVAAITHNGKQLSLGSFKNEIDAARAYDKAALEYHKEFARLNFPENSQSPSK